jgi:3-hydroxyisobutyrate dehydrogenase
VRVGFIGLGAMGYPMAGRLAAVFETSVWNRTTDVSQRHAAEFASGAAALEDVVDVDVIVSCLSVSGVVRDVVDSVLPALKAGTIWVDCTSGEYALSREIADVLATRGVSYLDAPVSGMVHGARSGTLSILVGGDAAVLEQVQPVLDVLGSNVIHVGPIGCGHLTKAANNSLLSTAMWAAAEALAVLERHGIAPETALAAINVSSGRSYVSQQFLPECVLSDAPRSPFELGTTAKDVTNLVHAAGRAGPDGAPATSTEGSTTDRSIPLLVMVERLFSHLTGELGPHTDAVKTYHAIQHGAPA